ncbi:MAG: GrpB family protein [Candidatus Kerfeldbacteria bacterium]
MTRALGLARGTVRLVQHHAYWHREFVHEKRRLIKQLGSLALGIEHVGSTAIPGLIAKPILDIALGVRKVRAIAGLEQRLRTIGYVRRRKGRDNDTLFVKGPETNRTVYLHIVRYRGVLWKQYVSFRDWMRSHPNDVRRYQQIKLELYRRFSTDRNRYTSAKSRYINTILQKGT